MTVDDIFGGINYREEPPPLTGTPPNAIVNINGQQMPWEEYLDAVDVDATNNRTGKVGGRRLSGKRRRLSGKRRRLSGKRKTRQTRRR